MERPGTHRQESAEETSQRYLGNLGLTWDELRGKKVLDIGASTGEFEHIARKHGVDVISLDKQTSDRYMPPKDSTFVVANALALPFADETFDYCVAHDSMHYHDADEIEPVFREASRVLKQGGRYHFNGTVLDENEGVKDVVNEHKLLEEMSRNAGFSKLQLKDYEGSMRPRVDVGDSHYEHYYIAFK